MSYDNALLTGAEVVTQTGDQDLANLAAGGELNLDDFVLAAHRDVYRRLVRRGIDPTALTNQAWLKDAVAYMATARLAMAGYLDRDGAETRMQEATRQVDDFVPTYSDSSEGAPRMAGEGIPAVGHMSEGLVYGVGDGRRIDRMRTNLPMDLG